MIEVAKSVAQLLRSDYHWEQLLFLQALPFHGRLGQIQRILARRLLYLRSLSSTSGEPELSDRPFDPVEEALQALEAEVIGESVDSSVRLYQLVSTFPLLLNPFESFRGNVSSPLSLIQNLTHALWC